MKQDFKPAKKYQSFGPSCKSFVMALVLIIDSSKGCVLCNARQTAAYHLIDESLVEGISHYSRVLAAV